MSADVPPIVRQLGELFDSHHGHFEGTWLVSDGGAYAVNVDALVTMQVELGARVKGAERFIIIGYTAPGNRVVVAEGIDTRAHAEAALISIAMASNARR